MRYQDDPCNEFAPWRRLRWVWIIFCENCFCTEACGIFRVWRKWWVLGGDYSPQGSLNCSNGPLTRILNPDYFKFNLLSSPLFAQFNWFNWYRWQLYGWIPHYFNVFVSFNVDYSTKNLPKRRKVVHQGLIYLGWLAYGRKTNQNIRNGGRDKANREQSIAKSKYFFSLIYMWYDIAGSNWPHLRKETD